MGHQLACVSNENLPLVIQVDHVRQQICTCVLFCLLEKNREKNSKKHKA